MNKWFIVDYLKSGDMYQDPIDANTAAEAADAVRAAWDRLSAYDQRRRESFFAGLYAVDDDGQPDGDPAEETADMAQAARDLETATPYMDDEIREEVHAEIAPCAPDQFLTEYQRRHIAKYGAPLVW